MAVAARLVLPGKSVGQCEEVDLQEHRTWLGIGHVSCEKCKKNRLCRHTPQFIPSQGLVFEKSIEGGKHMIFCSNPRTGHWGANGKEAAFGL